MKILIVDDEKSIRVALTDELKDAGYEITPAASG
jgi:DNA-binding response OmpR family regulator